MIEGNLIGEQPNELCSTGADAQKCPEVGQQEMANQKELGSPYGKFKNATSLLSAYNNLQAEFTRKSQKLAEFEKHGNPSKENNASQPQISASENGEFQPMYKSNGWKKQVSDFLEKNPDAKAEVKAISKILLENKEIACNKDCLNLAYKLTLANKYVKPALLANDEEFLGKYIVNNSRAKELIINEYIKSLKTRPTAPTTISGQAQSLSPTKPHKITSLEEAKTTIEKMFK